eukprot:jgi/Chlat1/5742/Chrsp38S05532
MGAFNENNFEGAAGHDQAASGGAEAWRGRPLASHRSRRTTRPVPPYHSISTMPQVGGKEDGCGRELTVSCPKQASPSSPCALATCTVHVYPPSGPDINISIPHLRDLREACAPALMVLHGTSGLDKGMLQQCKA